MMKRKIEETEDKDPKRVALDSEALEALEQQDIEDDKNKTAAAVKDGDSVMANDDTKDTEEKTGDAEDSSAVVSTDSTKKESHSVPISSHKVAHNDDPTYVHFRMLCDVKEAAAIVGKGGETISKIKELANARINVSENLKGVPERIVSVRGPSENVAKAFGLIVRMILEEPFDQPSSLESKQMQLKLLFPHPIMGYIIGKKGVRFREIEENSAASLKANDRILPSSTDRVLHINGVADAIHIATYYVAQTVIEHKQYMTKSVYYNPANFQANNGTPLSMLGNGSNPAAANMFGNQQMMGMMGNPMMGMGGYPMGGNQNNNGQNNTNRNRSNNMHIQVGKNQQPNMMNQFMGGYNGFPQMGGPNGGASNVNTGVPSNMNVNGGNNGADKINQDIYVPQSHIGLIIGKGGKNLKDIRHNTGCYVKVNDEVPGSTERKLTLIGNAFGIQQAIVLINNKIEAEKQRQQNKDKSDDK